MEEETTASLDDDPDETQNNEFLDEEDLNFDPPGLGCCNILMMTIF